MVKFVNAIGSEEQLKAKTAENWSKGEKLLGWLLSSKEIDGEHGHNTVFQFMGAKVQGDKALTTERFDLMGSGGLTWQLKKCQEGQLVEITCNGKMKNPKTGRPYVNFTVIPDEDNTPMPQTSTKSKTQLKQVTQEEAEEELVIDWGDSE